jgi:hypothetical protein
MTPLRKRTLAGSLALCLLLIAGGSAAWAYDSQRRQAHQELLRQAEQDLAVAEEARESAEQALAARAAAESAARAKEAAAAERNRLAACETERDVAKRVALERAAENLSSREAASIDPRDGLGQARVSLRAARRGLALASGTTEAAHYQAKAAVDQAQRLVSELELETAQVSLYYGVDPRDEVGRAKAAAKASELGLRYLKAPLPPAQPLTDFLASAVDVPDC